MTEEYAHRAAWPELLAKLESFGVTDYFIFRRGSSFFLYMHGMMREIFFMLGRQTKSVDGI